MGLDIEISKLTFPSWNYEDIQNIESIQQGELQPNREHFICEFRKYYILRDYLKHKYGSNDYDTYYMDHDKLTTLIDDYNEMLNGNELLIDVLGFNFDEYRKFEIEQTIELLSPCLTALDYNMLIKISLDE